MLNEIEISTEAFSMEEAQQVVNDVVENPSIIKEFFKEKGPIILGAAIKVAIAILVFWVGTKIIHHMVKVIRKSMEKHGTEVGVTNFLCTLLQYALDFVLIMFILGAFGLSGSIVAILGSAGLTVGLALQGSLSNFAGGVLIILLKPFLVGDYIIDSGSGKEGTVSEISIFYTKLLTVDHRMIMIPNGALSNSTITNVSKMDKRRLDFVMGVDYTSNLTVVKEILKKLAMEEEFVLKDQPVDVFVDELADSSINMGLRVWVRSEDYWNAKWAITEKIKNEFDAAGISIPFPQLDVHSK